MKRKEFIRTSSLALAGGVFIPYVSCTAKKSDVIPEAVSRVNWAGNYSYKAPELHEPQSTSELQDYVAKLGKQKALGSTHCFNDIADSPQSQISTRRLNSFSLDKVKKQLWIGAGARYGDFAIELYNQGFALHNLASLPHISVGGACATATHGSGISNGNLATKVLELELVKPDGDLVNLTADHPDFPAVIVGLGAFGVVSRFLLKVEEAFDVRQDVFLNLPLSTIKTNFETIMATGYSVSFFTNWINETISEVWIKRRMDSDPQDLGESFFGASAATQNVHPVIEQGAEKCSDQLGVPGPWYDRLPHFKMGFTPSTGKELHSEFFVPFENAVEAILAVERLKDIVYPQLIISEIRTVASDSFWMSPAYNRDSVAIHFTWKQNTAQVMKVIPMVEEALAPFTARPHWGKLFTMNRATLSERYEKFDEFVALAKRYDPDGKFRNAYLDRHIYE